MNGRFAQALAVPPRLLVGGVYLGFAVLAVGAIAKVAALGYVAMPFGIAITVAGLRATIRPPRSIATGTPPLQRLLGRTRAVGVLYALADVLWTLLSISVARAD